jgi:tRNA modification GTPase
MKELPGDTIAAISTALGPGAVALVRLSGDAAVDVADRVYRGRRPLADCPTHTVHHGYVVDREGRKVDEVMVTVLRAPHTYTTEHMIEFGCHGGPVPARRVLAACLEAGARRARRGEFTERAYLGGRLDLMQAEAVADVVGSETPRGLEMALGQLDGGLSAPVGELRATLVSMRTEVEAAVDFPEDVDAAHVPRRLAELSRQARTQVEALLRNHEIGAAVRDGVSVALVGKPNVGKSSLMNALLMRDRSIVTTLPGTTRDAIEELLHIDGIPMRLVDTAGWRETADVAERAGIDRARAAAGGAMLTVLVVDGSAPPDPEDAAVAAALDANRTLVVANKCDRGRELPGATSGDFAALFSDGPKAHVRVLWTSATAGTGLDELRAHLAEACLGPAHSEPARVSNVRHAAALRKVRDSLAAAERLMNGGEPYELVGSELAAATDALGEMTGETTPEEVLRHIFDRFCVGK